MKAVRKPHAFVCVRVYTYIYLTFDAKYLYIFSAIETDRTSLASILYKHKVQEQIFCSVAELYKCLYN